MPVPSTQVGAMGSFTLHLVIGLVAASEAAAHVSVNLQPDTPESLIWARPEGRRLYDPEHFEQESESSSIQMMMELSQAAYTKLSNLQKETGFSDDAWYYVKEALFVVMLVIVVSAITSYVTSKKVEQLHEEAKAAHLNLNMPDVNIDVKSDDFEEMMKTFKQVADSQLGPQAAKGQAVRSILESRLYEFPEKAKSFIMNELNSTAGSLLRVVEAEEASMLLDLDKAISSSFPPVSTLLAGLLSPVMLSFSSAALIAQLLIVIAPLLILTSWSVYEDYGVPCAIPSMTLWVKIQFGMSLFLAIANISVYLTISNGKKALDEKTQAMQERIKVVKSSEGMGLNEMKELMVCNSVLIEEALILEDSVKASFWFNGIGVATTVWLMMSLWTFALVVGWTFVPGQIAFADSAKGAPNYCGAWATVLTARIDCVLALLFLIVNFCTVLNWLATVLMRSQAFAETVLASAKDFDRAGLGFPVAELLVKAFLLRSSSDCPAAKLNVALADQVMLEEKRSELQRKLADLQGKIAGRQSQVQKLQEKAADIKINLGVEDPMGLEAGIKTLESADLHVLGETWKARGVEAVAEAEAKVYNEQAMTADLETLVQKITELANQLKDSETFQTLSSQAQMAAEQAKSAAEAAAVKARASAEASLQSASQAAEQLKQQAQDAAADLQTKASSAAASASGALQSSSQVAMTMADQVAAQSQAAQAAAQEALEKAKAARGGPP